MNPNIKKLISLVVIVGILVMFYFLMNDTKGQKSTIVVDIPTENQYKNETVVYKPVLDPANFSTDIKNPFFTLPVGTELVYEGDTDEGKEKVVITISGETKEIMGIKTLVYTDKVYLNDELVEDTKDYIAQDQKGNVWYFGEDVDNYEDGQVKDHAGSWLAGENGAQPGIWIKAENVVGDSYRQEYYKGEAEDMRDVVAVDENVETIMGNYSGCVKMYDWTPLDPEAREHKIYCQEVGAMVKEIELDTNNEIVLVSKTMLQ